jgi:hypothetical protein
MTHCRLANERAAEEWIHLAQKRAIAAWAFRGSILFSASPSKLLTLDAEAVPCHKWASTAIFIFYASSSRSEFAPMILESLPGKLLPLSPGPFFPDW